jgi:hypothetical protein
VLVLRSPRRQGMQGGQKATKEKSAYRHPISVQLTVLHPEICGPSTDSQVSVAMLLCDTWHGHALQAGTSTHHTQHRDLGLARGCQSERECHMYHCKMEYRCGVWCRGSPLLLDCSYKRQLLFGSYFLDEIRDKIIRAKTNEQARSKSQIASETSADFSYKRQ